MTKKNFLQCLRKTEFIYPFSGKSETVYQILYLPKDNIFCGFYIRVTSKEKAWEEWQNRIKFLKA